MMSNHIKTYNAMSQQEQNDYNARGMGNSLMGTLGGHIVGGVAGAALASQDYIPDEYKTAAFLTPYIGGTLAVGMGASLATPYKKGGSNAFANKEIK